MKKILESSVGKIIFAPMELEDVHYQANYFYNSPKGFLTSIGFDVDLLPEKSQYIKGLKSRIKAQINRASDQKKYTAIVAKIDGVAIGTVVLNLTPEVDPANAYAHFHIWDENLRGKGLGEVILKNGLKLLMDHQKRSTALIEPHKNNIPMNKLMLKCGFKFMGDSIFSGPMTSTFESKKYLIERGQL